MMSRSYETQDGWPKLCCGPALRAIGFPFSFSEGGPGTQGPTRVVLPVLGSILICLGPVLMVATIRLFMTVGKGTLAPWNPPQRLVVQGVYRYVRNPMISGGLLIVLGEALLAASLPILVLFVVFLVANAVYIPLVEEQGLVKRFGDDYLTYRQNVPRWIPRLTPWHDQAGATLQYPRRTTP